MGIVYPIRTTLPQRDPVERRADWVETAGRYTEIQARAEAMRCIQCQVPACERGCPASVPIRDFIRHVADGDLAAASAEIARRSTLPAVCSRVCPVERQCESLCVIAARNEPVAIARLEQHVADAERMRVEAAAVAVPAMTADGVPAPGAPPVASRPERVAIVGSGPAGLAAAEQLARLGYGVTVFEALHVAGGVMRYGIPSYRLPREIVDDAVARVERLGIEIRTNVVIGRTLSVDQLLGELGYSAVFIGTGAGLPKLPSLPGQHLDGIYSANELLARVNLMGANDFPRSHTPVLRPTRAVVLGHGFVAIDAARSVVRLGALDVRIISALDDFEASPHGEDRMRAEEEGVGFDWLSVPVRFVGGDAGRVTAVELTRLGPEELQPDGSLARLPIPGSEHLVEADLVVVALGAHPSPILSRTTGIATDSRGRVRVDPVTAMTSRPGIFAGGETVMGAATVVRAMSAGRDAAAAIDGWIQANPRKH